MNGARGLVIAIVTSLVVGVSAGMVTGILIMRFAGPLLPLPPRPPFFGPGRPGDPFASRGREMLMHRLEADLDLRADQRVRVAAVLESARVVREAARESVRVRIERELTPEQRVRWRALENRYDRMRHWRAGPWDGRR